MSTTAIKPGKAGVSADAHADADERRRDHVATLERLGWSDALIKATVDAFDYAVLVRGVGVLRFRSCEPSGGGRWVRLFDWVNDNRSEALDAFPYPCPRGLEIPLRQIVWSADAPEGS